jgi:N-acyl-phosphatidylethanolamine-hydrolysing phospholipase D
VTELDWWHETLLTFPSASQSPAASATGADTAESWESTDLVLKFAFTPAQHRSGRGLLDHMKTLWGSWMFGVVGQAEWAGKSERGMKGWQGFKCYFGG